MLDDLNGHVYIRAMSVVTTSPVPSGFPPGLPAELAAAVLWFMAKIVRLVGWRLLGQPREAMGMEVQRYLNGCTRRFVRVLERLAAGEAFVVRASRAGQARKVSAVARVRLPGQYGWVARLGEDVRMTVAIIGHHLNRTEVSAMIAACPQAQRVLRPMCHVLGVDAPCVGRRVRKRRVRSQAIALPSPRPSPANAGEGEGGMVPSPLPWSASQPKPAKAEEGEGGEQRPAKRLTRKEREAALWYPNLEGKPMKLLPRRLPRD